MRTRLITLAALVTIGASACSLPAVQRAVPAAPSAPTLVATNVKPACTGDVVTVIGDDEVPCDVSPPQRLDVNGVTPDECLDMGGRVVTVDMPMDGLVNCEGVDY